MSFSGTYFDARSLVGRQVAVEVQGDRTLVLTDGEFSIVAPGDSFSIKGPLGSIPRFAILPGGVLEVPEGREADEALSVYEPSGPLRRAELWLGAHVRVAAGIAAALVAAGCVMVFAGLPALARRIAFSVPPVVEHEIGKASQAALARYVQQFSYGSDETAEFRAKTQLSYLASCRHLHVDPSLVVVNLAQPNAFALPGGTIVVTTGLLRLGLSDEEMAGVLAHELGHEELRHGIQSVLRQSSALIVVSLMTGDLATLSTFSSSLPFLLITRGYSRGFEREADAYAVGLLKEASLNPGALADALEKLEKEGGGPKATMSYLGTHPDPEERIATIRSSSLALGAPSEYTSHMKQARAFLPTDNARSVAEYKKAFSLRKPDAQDLYDAAIAATSSGDSDSAFRWLDEALQGGLKDPKAKLKNAGLDKLHRDPRWEPLLNGTDEADTPPVLVDPKAQN